MLKLLADENIPRRLVILLKTRGVDIIRLQDLGARGVSNQELVRIANRLTRTILTRDFDFTMPYFLSLTRSRVIYISYQPSRNELLRLAERIASIVHQLEPKPGLLVIVGREYIEIHD